MNKLDDFKKKTVGATTQEIFDTHPTGWFQACDALPDREESEPGVSSRICRALYEAGVLECRLARGELEYQFKSRRSLVGCVAASNM